MSVQFIGRFLFIAIVLLCFGQSATRAAENTRIPVPKTIIYAGQTISSNLLRDRIVPQKYLNRVSVITDYSEIVGKVAKVTLVPSRPIAINTVLEPYVVKVNVRTIMNFSYGGLRITAEVAPLNAARAGEMVRARNLGTGVIVYGTAQADGTIRTGGQLVN